MSVGTKNILVTGALNMFGTPRQRMTRLLETVLPNTSTLVVEPGLDWTNGDILGLAATSIPAILYENFANETAIVESYDSNTGIVKLTEPVQGYHFGAPESTGADYSDVDMRGEVLLLTSNVNITASKDETSMTPSHPEPY